MVKESQKNAAGVLLESRLPPELPLAFQLHKSIDLFHGGSIPELVCTL